MGSLSSRPKVPAQQPVIYTIAAPTSAPSTPSNPATTPSSSGGGAGSTGGSSTSGGGTTPPTPDEEQAQTRSLNLLDRRRGVLSTIATGFRGVLSQDNAAAPQRKTLLGE